MPDKEAPSNCLLSTVRAVKVSVCGTGPAVVGVAAGVVDAGSRVDGPVVWSPTADPGAVPAPQPASNNTAQATETP
ncbi:hypothetical protein Air01nite_66940 [Asanoa iriomotensis]|uniref:Uncharacterized protein n=1 Tax=Asanoa iriomotensis TaxID=234613 RepID=A0ABQ4CCV8_9ACTN|nr:hypothetical protein Air01nite_66940 [Asanoa iriomotensis]